MFKQFVTLLRGRTNDTAEIVLDGHALTILRQQLRECADAIGAARRAVAVAIAQNDQETQQCQRVIARIADLERRTLSAMEQGKNELAREAAESIAILEMERDNSLTAQKSFASEISRLKTIVRASEMRLRELERGQRLATATEKTQRLRETGASSTLNALKDAESTLDRLRTRQKQLDVTAIAMAEMEGASDPAALIEKLADSGCGVPLKTRADDVLRRLSEAARPSATTEIPA